MPKVYDLEERTCLFATAVHDYARKIGFNPATARIVAQLMNAAGSVGANYIEANEALSKKDISCRIKIARKEAKETRYRLSVIEPAGEQDDRRRELLQEATELLKILSSIVNKAT